MNEKMIFIREYQDGNGNAKMSLMDQKATTEKKKHDTTIKLDYTRQKHEILLARFNVIQE